MAKEQAKEKCRCSHWAVFVAIIFGVIGLYSIILGIKTQWDSALIYTNWMAMLYYLIGLIFVACAKMSKYHACCKCDTHKM